MWRKSLWVATGVAVAVLSVAVRAGSVCIEGYVLPASAIGISTTTVADEGACWLLCTATASCEGWTIDKTSRQCSLFSTSPSTGLVPAPQQPSKCSAIAACDALVDQTGGADYRQLYFQPSNPYLCADACMADPACAGYSVVNGNSAHNPNCYLKSSVPAFIPSSVSCFAEVRSRPRTGAVASSSVIITWGTSSGDRECGWSCRATPSCTAWSFRVASSLANRWVCSLLTSSAGTAAAPSSAAATLVVADMHCEAASAASPGARVLTTATLATAGSDVTCARSCAQNASCTAWGMANTDIVRPACTLYTGEVSVVPTAGSCVQKPQCAPATKATSATALGPATKVSGGTTECAALCRSTAGCTAYGTDLSGSQATASCQLYSAVAAIGATAAKEYQCFAQMGCTPATLAAGRSISNATVRAGDDECAALCLSTASCSAYTMLPSRTDVTAVFVNPTTQVPTIVSVPMRESSCFFGSVTSFGIWDLLKTANPVVQRTAQSSTYTLKFAIALSWVESVSTGDQSISRFMMDTVHFAIDIKVDALSTYTLP
eukprot:m51a1_g10032 hypothetical protein (548) ;mRNA; r:128728-130891